MMVDNAAYEPFTIKMIMSSQAFQCSIDDFVERYGNKNIDLVVGMPQNTFVR